MMQQREISAMINAIQVGGIVDYADLDALAERFPYCSTFQVLRAIGLHERDSIDFKSQLNKASVYIQDRSKLYEYTLRKRVLEQIEESQLPAVIEDQPGAAEQNSEVSGPEKSEEIEKNPDAYTTDIAEEAGESKIENGEFPPSEEVSHSREIPISESLLPVQTLEDEIMREAISQLSMLEAETSLEAMAAMPSDKPELSAVDEHPKQPLSFSDWLLSKSAASAPKPKPDREIIDKFIQENPSITPARVEFFSPSQMGKMSLIEDETFVTETLAKIYERQGDFKRAAKAYKNLGLKFPEKSIYFADLQKRAEGQIKS